MEGLHFHTLCEQDADDLECTFYVFEEQFASYLKQVRWLNLGGGHHITRPGYQIERLKKLIGYIRETYGLAVYLEPGEAVALNAGYLVTEVCDIVHNGMDILILDASAACHMPDVLEMPYRPPLRDGFTAGSRNTPIGCPRSPVWRGTSSGTTVSHTRFRSATVWCLRTWQSTRW